MGKDINGKELGKGITQRIDIAEKEFRSKKIESFTR